MNIPIISPGKWVDVELWLLRGAGGIKIVRDQVQRRIKKDDSQEYYLKNQKDTLEPQEFESIYSGSKGEDVLKLFSPAKGVYWPINFILKTVRPFTDAERKYIDEATRLTDDENKMILAGKDEKEREKIKQEILKKKFDEKKDRIKEIYQKIYKAQFESVVDTATLNHGIYKVQKNALRFQGGGMDLATKMSILTIIIVIAFILCSWATYNYFIQPGMIFWNDHSKEVIEIARLQHTGTSAPEIQEPVPVPSGG